MNINLRTLQSTLERKLGLLDTLKNRDCGLFDKGTSNEAWHQEVELLQNEIDELFQSFDEQMNDFNCKDIMVIDRYEALLQSLKRDYTNICQFIDSRKKRSSLFGKSIVDYQNIQMEHIDNSKIRSQLFREKGALEVSIDCINNIMDQAVRTTTSLKNQHNILRNINDKARNLKKKSLYNVGLLINSILSLQFRQEILLTFVFCCLVIFIVYWKFK
ncbi:hypothetical protein ACR3K2_16600 [Cryptosporidium serpentis]